MKIRNYFGAVATVALSALILFAGTFLASWIDTFVPSYKNQVTEIIDSSTKNEVYQINSQDELQLYPWNYCSEENQSSLTQAQKEFLLQKKVPDFIFAMLDVIPASDSEKTSLLNQCKLLTIPIAKDTHITENLPPTEFQDHKYFIFKNVQLENRNFYINCAVTQEGRIVSCFAKQGSENPTDSALQKAKIVLQERSTNKSPDLPNYVEKIVYASNKYEQKSISILLEKDNFLKTQAINEPGGLTTENLIILNYRIDSGIQLIFYFDPVRLTFCGFHIQQPI